MNGGPGGDGEQRGTGGAPGTVDVVVGVVTADDESFKPGATGRPCNYTMTAKATVNADPAGHEPFLNLTKITQGAVKLGPNGTIEVTFGITMNGTITPGPNGTFTFTANGSGTISGRTATGTFTNGTIQVDANGRVTNVTGTFAFGAGGELPGGQPISVDVQLTAPVQGS
jgi:hypothetical protein